MSRLQRARPAVRQQLRARVAIDGPSGSGKTWTALEWATVLAGPSHARGRILVIDTEHESAELYADMFTFETLAWDPPYDPVELAATITDASDYAVLVLDSMSHFWEGEGGTLDVADAAAQRTGGGNSFAGWKVATPQLRHLLDSMLGAPAHVVATMRTKTEWVVEVNEKGKSVPRRVGTAPVMRSGVEYEFTVVGDMDLEHRLVFTKSRCSALADMVVQPGRAAEAAETFADWLQGGEPMPTAEEVAALKDDLNEREGSMRKMFRSRFGHPDRLTAEQLQEAKAWLASAHVVVTDGQGSNTEPGGEATPVTTSPSGEGHGGGTAANSGVPSPDVCDGCDLDDLTALMAMTGATKPKVLTAARRLAKANNLDPPQKFADITTGRLLDLLVDWLGEQDFDPPPSDGGSNGSRSETGGPADDISGASADHEPTTPTASASEQVAVTAPVAVGGVGPKASPNHRRFFAVATAAADAAGCTSDELRARLASIVSGGNTESASGFTDSLWCDMADLAQQVIDGPGELHRKANGRWTVGRLPVGRPTGSRARSAA